MIYLIEYDRKRGAIVRKKAFSANERGQAQGERLALELDLNKSRTLYEVVLLEASDEETLKRTHQRYFRSPRELLESMTQP
jgi:hypothetical protein